MSENVPEQDGLSRRALLRNVGAGAAWGTAAVVLATAAPAASASPPAPSGAVIVFNNVTAGQKWTGGTVTGVNGNFGIRVNYPGTAATFTVSVVVSSATHITTQTFSGLAQNANQTFEFDDLPKGTYTVTATAIGTLTSADGYTGGPWPLATVTQSASAQVTVP